MNTDKIYAESIANEYSVKEASKVVALKKLDRRAKSGANIFAYTFGVVSALVLGTGMCLTMGVLGNGTQMSFICGIIIGIIGIAGACINYPIYKTLKKRGMDKYAGDIIRLANEISEAAE
ncbi:MAG: dihydropteridine reductase [Lachnospiraceae bacterium]|nr:dihydropteridine reductase [Lachnospiraceae bacterium]